MTARKPNHLKEISGTIRPSRKVEEIELPTLDDCPEAPDWLPNAHAIKEFNHLAPILFKIGLLNQGNLAPLGVLCSLHGKMVQLWAAGESPTGHMLAQYRNLINDFGLTPVAQGKVKPVGEKPQGNAFANNGRKSA